MRVARSGSNEPMPAVVTELRPLGSFATWQAERVGSLRPGIAEMALETARAAAAAGDPRPVFIVPVLWRLRFTADVSRGLGREIAIIERSLRLPSARGRGLRERFAGLPAALPSMRAAQLGLRAPAIYSASLVRSEWYESVLHLFEIYDFLALPTAQVFPFGVDMHWPSEIAAAASLVQGQGAEGQPVVLVRGLAWSGPDNNAYELVRPAAEDMFR